MLFRRPATDDNRLPETVNDGDKTLSLLEQFKKDVADKKIDLSGRKAFVSMVTISLHCSQVC